jgi:hypothetical protein
MGVRASTRSRKSYRTASLARRPGALSRAALAGHPADFTARLKVVVRLRGVPVTVIANVPGGVDGLVERVNWVEHVGLQPGGSNDAVAPLGRPEAEKDVLWLKPALSVAMIVLEPDAPGATVIPPTLNRM